MVLCSLMVLWFLEILYVTYCFVCLCVNVAGVSSEMRRPIHVDGLWSRQTSKHRLHLKWFDIKRCGSWSLRNLLWTQRQPTTFSTSFLLCKRAVRPMEPQIWLTVHVVYVFEFLLVSSQSCFPSMIQKLLTIINSYITIIHSDIHSHISYRVCALNPTFMKLLSNLTHWATLGTLRIHLVLRPIAVFDICSK